MSPRYHPYGNRGAPRRRLFTQPTRRGATKAELAKLKRAVALRRPEMKQFYTTGNVANIYSNVAGITNLIGSIAQGAGYNQRLGREIRIHRIRFNLRWVSATLVHRDALIVRNILVKSKQQSFNAAPTESALLLDYTQNWRSEYQPDMVPSKYSVVDDKQSTARLQYSAQLPEILQEVDHKFSTPHKVVWSLDTDDLIEGGLYSCMGCNQPTNSVTCYYQIIVDFTD